MCVIINKSHIIVFGGVIEPHTSECMTNKGLTIWHIIWAFE